MPNNFGGDQYDPEYNPRKRRRSRASALEYHVYAQFPCNNIGVRVAITLSERTAQRVGGVMSEFADEVWYKIKARKSTTKPYRASRMWRRRR